MEIIVEGLGEKRVTPDEVVLNLTFNVKGQMYDEVLEKGVLNVKTFIDQILIPNGFNSDLLKTKSFIVKEEKKYNADTKSYYFDAFVFNQSATLKFDYDKDRLAKLLIIISKMENAPICYVNFGTKNIDECKKSILADAFNDAKLKAEAIASAAGLNLSRCAKVDFKPFTSNYISGSSFNSDHASYRSMAKEMDNFVNSFTPEDINVSEKLYCLWIAE